MTLYLNYNVDLQNERITTSSWSNTEIPVLAIATNKKRITFFQDEGANIKEHDMLKSSQITSMCWHPTDMILAYGLASGHIGVWVDEENYTKEELNHDGKVMIVKFNSEGNRIISSDDKGVINVWRFAPLYFMCSYKQSYKIEEIIIPKFSYEKMDKEKLPPQEKLSSLFFFSNSGGMLHLADDANSSPEICRVGGKMKSLLFYEKENAIIIITSNLLLVKCQIHFSQQLIPKKVKLSIAGNPEEIKCCWASEGLIAIVSGDDLVRFFYLDTDQSYFLSMNDHQLGQVNAEDSFTCIDFSPRKRTLIVGGAKGKVYMWKCNLTANIIPIGSEAWEPFCVVDTIPGISMIKWSLYMGLIHIENRSGQHSMLSETILNKKMNDKMKILQISQNEIEIVSSIEETYVSKRIELGHTAKGISIYNSMMLIWTGALAYLYDVDLGTLDIKLRCTLSLKSNLMAINEESVIVATTKAIEIYSLEGEIKDSIPMNNLYGEITIFSTMDKFLLVCTSNNYYGVFDISRRNLKQTVMFRKFEKNGNNLGEIREAAVNCKGNLIIFLIDNMVNSEMRVPETKFIIFDVEMDSFIDYEISANRIPIEIVWDFKEPRVFGIHSEYAKDINDSKPQMFNEDDPLSEKKNEWFGPEFYVLFYTSENGIHQLESHKISKNNQGVFAIEMPKVFFITSQIDPKTQSSLMEMKFQFFQGLDNIDDNTKKSLCDFTLLMACGKLDEAYKIVKNIKNDNIWENMAHICIKTKRLDVLEVCLSNMRFERGIKAFRESKHEKEPEAKLAAVAMHLNMIEEAKELLKEVNRWDVLIRFYICIGEYDKAIDTAQQNDRIDLQNTYYRIAQHYEQVDDIDNAIKYYKLSNCGAREIPRMLISKNKFDLLKSHMDESESKSGILWWANYLESQGDFAKAMTYYKKAKDTANIVRLLLKENKLKEAKKICDDTKDTDSAYLLGGYYESNNDVKNAILYYGTSGRTNQAFRLAKENGLDNDIYALGMKAPKNTQNLIAEYFEGKNEIEKAITLYLLGSNIRKGLNLCLATNQYDKVREISETLESKQDKETLKALAEYFIEQQQQEKALGLFIRIKEYDTAMKLCENYKVKITKETANAILVDLDKEKDNKTKQQLTSRLAKLLMMQGEFELAHDIYVKINNLKKAMKCCIKMGNKDKVIEFAHMCRMPELYIMAANFLQNLEWTKDIVKIIVSFFNRAKAYYNLANFYEVFASIEINEKQNLTQACELYNEAMKTVLKVRENDEKKDNKINELKNKINFIKKYNDALNKISSTPGDALKICEELLSVKGMENVVQEKEIYKLIFRIYYGAKDFQSAYSCMDVCRREKKVTGLAGKDILKAVLDNVGKTDELDLYI